MGAWIQTISDL